jgi:hypothetical protein
MFRETRESQVPEGEGAQTQQSVGPEDRTRTVQYLESFTAKGRVRVFHFQFPGYRGRV